MMASGDKEVANIVVIGGGISGTTCAEYILSCSEQKINIFIITPKDTIKTAVIKRPISRNLKEITTKECSNDTYEREHKNIFIKVAFATEIDPIRKCLFTSNDEEIPYTKLCVCTGAKPSLIVENNPNVICIRDTDSVSDMLKRLSNAKKIVVVGNGGIALELVYEISGCEVVWCIKNDSIGNTFFDKGAATFLVASIQKNSKYASQTNTRKVDQLVFKRKRNTIESFDEKGYKARNDDDVLGTSLGPDWSSNRKLQGSAKVELKRNVTIHYSCEVLDITNSSELNMGAGTSEGNVSVRLSTGEIILCDFVVSAIGVLPNVSVKLKGENIKFDVCDEGGILVDENMRTNIADIYAAGDVCTPRWSQHSDKWFPMKLWSQGWQTGAFAGRCIVEHFQRVNDIPLDFSFELFTHITTFFGYKVCLLGAYNCQRLHPDECSILLRYTPGVEYLKVVLKNGRIKGCVLIGETDLEETFQNLILNDLYVGFLGDSLLDPDVEIDDYFD